MKYFTYDLIAAANDWVEQTEEARLEAEQRFCRVAQDYHSSLAKIKARISLEAWNFFAVLLDFTTAGSFRSQSAMVWIIELTAKRPSA